MSLLNPTRKDTGSVLHTWRGAPDFFLVTLQAVFWINISVHIPFIVAGIFLIVSTGIAYKLWHTNTIITN